MQVATIYKHNDAYNPKEYYFKVQHVKKSSKGKDERKTIAKTKVDLARFCTTDPDPAPQEVFLQLKCVLVTLFPYLCFSRHGSNCTAIPCCKHAMLHAVRSASDAVESLRMDFFYRTGSSQNDVFLCSGCW